MPLKLLLDKMKIFLLLFCTFLPSRLRLLVWKLIGFKVGTNQYANCMMQQDNNRQKLNTQNRKELNKMSKCLMKNSGWSTTPKTFGQILGEC